MALERFSYNDQNQNSGTISTLTTIVSGMNNVWSISNNLDKPSSTNYPAATMGLVLTIADTVDLISKRRVGACTHALCGFTFSIIFSFRLLKTEKHRHSRVGGNLFLALRNKSLFNPMLDSRLRGNDDNLKVSAVLQRFQAA